MCKPNFIKFDRLELLGVLSERSIILYALISDRLSWTKFRDADGVPFCYFTIEEVADIFKISQTQAKQAFKELETARLIIRRRSGQGKPSKIFQTDGKPPVKTDGKPPVKTDGKPPAIQNNNIQTYSSSSSDDDTAEKCGNQMTFDDFFIEMTVHDTIGKIIAEIITENSNEFSDISPEIADFVAEKVIKAAENRKIANIRGYARAALRHGRSDFEAAESLHNAHSTGYGATYDIAAYESTSVADDPRWD